MRKILTINIIVVIIMCMSFGSFASNNTTSGTVETQYQYTTIYPTNSLNQNVIDAFNNMSVYERAELMPQLGPIFFKQIGILSRDAYQITANLYNANLSDLKSDYTTADDYNEDASVSDGDKKMYTKIVRGGSMGHNYEWYDDFKEFLALNIKQDNGVLVLDSTTAIYDLYDEVIAEEQQQNGLINVELFSYKNINSSNFGNLSQYSSFIGLCRAHKNYKYVLILKNRYDGGYPIRIMFPRVVPNLYNNGTTVGNTLRICNGNGVTITQFDTYEVANGSVTDWTLKTTTMYTNNFKLGGATIPTGSTTDSSGNQYTANFGIYTLNDDKENMLIYTSLAGWINSQGHYEPTYQLGNNYGIVPSAVVSAPQITTYYQTTYGDTTTTSTTIYYPPTYDPTGQSYDTGTHTLSFDGIGSFLQSLGALIGSIINGLAEGLANIIDSLASVINNLRANLLQGTIFEFLSAFIGWLPVEIVSLLTALFAVTVIFAIVKLIKGFF